jgi:hypothetical protein
MAFLESLGAGLAVRAIAAWFGNLRRKKPTAPASPPRNDYAGPPNRPLFSNKVDKSAVIFTPKDPYPEGFKTAKLGCRLSTLKALYPQGKTSSSSFTLGDKKGVFWLIMYFFDTQTNDPKIDRIVFYIGPLEEKVAYVRKQAFEAFGTNPVSKVQGAILRWTIGNVRVQIENGEYTIMPKSKQFHDEVMDDIKRLNRQKP